MPQNTTVYVRVGEGKDLPIKDITGSSDPFCTVRVDNEEVARTATVFKSLTPFWGEDFTLHLSNSFQNISVYVYDEDRITQNDIIGKVSLDREDIVSSPRGIEKWFKLMPVDKDFEIQGEVEIETLIDDTDDLVLVHIQVHGARDLAAKDPTGSSDPFLQLVCGENKFTTSIMKKTRFPRWNESFTFKFSKPFDKSSKILFECIDWDRLTSNDFMGQFEVLLSSLTTGKPHRRWYQLKPRPVTLSSDGQPDLGAIRLKVRCTEQEVLPSVCYEPLKQLLIDAVSQAEDSNMTFFSTLREVMVADLNEMAYVLVKFFLGCDQVIAFLDCSCHQEINGCENVTTLFRANSLGTKAADQFMKVVGMPYLRSVLGPIVDRIYVEDKYCELDPIKIERKEKQVLAASESLLTGYLTSILDCVLSSSAQCPPLMKEFFRILNRRVIERFPDNADLPYLAISSFIFLRFFAAALLSPKLFGLRREHPNMRVSRTLTLGAKTLQSIGNLVESLGRSKEAYMAPLHSLIRDHVPKLRKFIDELVQVDENVPEKSNGSSRSAFGLNITLLSGHLSKRAADNIKYTVSPLTFKRRYFWLSHKTLSYADSEQGQVKKNIDVSSICAVERVDRNAFRRNNMLQVIQRISDQEMTTTYICTKNVNEQIEWLSAIRKVCVCNRRMLRLYHPGAFLSGKWTCCRHNHRFVPGCSVAHSAVIGDWRDPLDPDMELQIVYSQLYIGQDTIREKCGSLLTTGGSTIMTKLLEVIAHLEKEHEVQARTLISAL